MKRVKLFALISLLFIGLGHAWGAEATLTQAEIKKATAGGSYAERAVESTSGTWTGKMIINTSTGFVQINKNSNNYYLGSPTFEGGVTKIVITTCNSTASGRTFYIMGNTNTAQPTNGTYGSGSTSSSNGTASIDITGSPTNFYIYANGAAYISSVTVTYTTSSGGVTYTDNFFQQAGTHTTPTCRGKRSRYVPPAHPNKSHLHLHETPIKLVTRQCFNGSLHGF